VLLRGATGSGSRARPGRRAMSHSPSSEGERNGSHGALRRMPICEKKAAYASYMTFITRFLLHHDGDATLDPLMAVIYATSHHPSSELERSRL
jgi:hypothetical protein